MTQKEWKADGTSANPFLDAGDDDSSLCDDFDIEDPSPFQDFLYLTSRSGTGAVTEFQTLPERSGPSTTPDNGMHHPCTSAEEDECRAQGSWDRRASSVAQGSDQEVNDTNGTGNASSVVKGDHDGNVQKDEHKDDKTYDKKGDKKGGNEKDDDNNDSGDGGAQQAEHVPAPEQHGSGIRSTTEANATKESAQQKYDAQLEIVEGIPEPESSSVPSKSPSCDDEYWAVKRVAGKRIKNGITEYLIC